MTKQYGSEPCSFHFPITPNDTTPISPVPRAIYIATDGDLVIKDSANTTVTYAVLAGTILPFRPHIITLATSATVYGWY